MSNLQAIKSKILNYQNLTKNEKKYSYMIVKPNGEKHFSSIIELIRQNGLNIENVFKIDDYEYVNILLHPENEKQKFINAINRVYKDFYSNYGILILISKDNIFYTEFVEEIIRLKITIRKQYDYDYIATVLDISKIGMQCNEESIKIISKTQEEIAKQKMNEKGTYLVISINEIHSPDANLENTVNEMRLLFENYIITEGNIIPESMINMIKKYGTFTFLQDLD